MTNRVAGLGCLIIALLSVFFVGFDLCVIGFFLVIGGVLIFGDTKEEWEERRRRDFRRNLENSGDFGGWYGR